MLESRRGLTPEGSAMRWLNERRSGNVEDRRGYETGDPTQGDTFSAETP